MPSSCRMCVRPSGGGSQDGQNGNPAQLHGLWRLITTPARALMVYDQRELAQRMRHGRCGTCSGSHPACAGCSRGNRMMRPISFSGSGTCASLRVGDVRFHALERLRPATCFWTRWTSTSPQTGRKPGRYRWTTSACARLPDTSKSCCPVPPTARRNLAGLSAGAGAV